MVLSVGDPVRGEVTNVAVAVFGPDGRRVAVRVGNVRRAIDRGDVAADATELRRTVDDVVDMDRSQAAARNRRDAVIRWREAGGSILDDAEVVAEQAYRRFVGGHGAARLDKMWR